MSGVVYSDGGCDASLLFYFLDETMQKLTETVFATGPKDDLRVIDAYGIDTKVSINSIQEKDSEVPADKEAAESLIPPTPEKKETLSKLSEVKDAVTSQSDMVSTLVENTASGSKSDLLALSDSISSKITIPTSLQELKVTIGDIKSTLKNVNLKDVKSMVSLVKDVSKGNITGIINNAGALGALGGNIVEQATALGIPNAYKAVCSGISDVSAIAKLTNQILPGVIKNSDVSLLSQIANGPAVKSVKSMSPSLISSFSNSFNELKGITQNGKIAAGLSVLSSFDKIDPDWCLAKSYTGSTGGSDIFSGQAISGASKDFKSMISAVSSTGLLTSGLSGSLNKLSNGLQKTAALSNAMYKQQEIKNKTSSFIPEAEFAQAKESKVVTPSVLTKLKDFYAKEENDWKKIPNQYDSEGVSVSPTTSAVVTPTALEKVKAFYAKEENGWQVSSRSSISIPPGDTNEMYSENMTTDTSNNLKNDFSDVMMW